MNRTFRSYIDGRWIESSTARREKVVDPATEEPVGELCFAEPADIAHAVAAARSAFESYSRTSKQQRLALLRRILSEYDHCRAQVAAAITVDIGAPAWLAEQVQAVTGEAHLKSAIETLERYSFSERVGARRTDRVPIGVCALVTAWSWPIDQIAHRVVRALAVGCTMVLKPSELAPASAQLWAQILAAAGVPAGVFNLVMGDDATGAALSAHAGVDMVSCSGWPGADPGAARAAAAAGKRMCQEPGGKCANIVLDDAELGAAIPAAIRAVCLNSGQSASAPTRLLVPMRSMDDAVTLARATAERIEVGTPASNALMGPVACAQQWRKVQDFIRHGLAEGATLVAGGLGKPAGLATGYYVKPTVFANVSTEMKIAHEAILGPLVVMIGYQDEKDAIRIANGTGYGLAGYVQSSDESRATRVAAHLRVGQVVINGAALDLVALSGGFEASGSAHEWSEHNFADYLKLRAISGSEASHDC